MERIMIEAIQILDTGNGESNHQINIRVRAYTESLASEPSFVGRGLGTDLLGL